MYFEKLFQILSSMYVCAVTPSVSFSLVLLQDSGVLSDMRQSMLIRIRWVGSSDTLSQGSQGFSLALIFLALSCSLMTIYRKWVDMTTSGPSSTCWSSSPLVSFPGGKSRIKYVIL